MILLGGLMDRTGDAWPVESSCEPRTDDVESVEEPRNYDFGWSRLMRQRPKRCGHAHGIAPARLLREHAHKAKALCLDRANLLLKPGLGARDNEGPHVERENFAECVVAAHGHHPCGLLHQHLDLGIEG